MKEKSSSEARRKEIRGHHAALFRLSADLEAVISEGEIYRCVAEGLHDTLGYDFVAIFRFDPKTGLRNLVASAGFTDPVTPLAPGKGLSGKQQDC